MDNVISFPCVWENKKDGSLQHGGSDLRECDGVI
jgi:hypothetical protein